LKKSPESDTVPDHRQTPGDIAMCYADAGKAKRERNWEAARNLEEMCADSGAGSAKIPTGI
jgi:UDP-glucose 4-epimerase